MKKINISRLLSPYGDKLQFMFVSIRPPKVMVIVPLRG